MSRSKPKHRKSAQHFHLVSSDYKDARGAGAATNRVQCLRAEVRHTAAHAVGGRTTPSQLRSAI